MKIYSAGWALQSPTLNMFKRFLRANPAVEISGVNTRRRFPMKSTAFQFSISTPRVH